MRIRMRASSSATRRSAEFLNRTGAARKSEDSVSYRSSLVAEETAKSNGQTKFPITASVWSGS